MGESYNTGREEFRNNPTGDRDVVQINVFQILFRRGIQYIKQMKAKQIRLKDGKGESPASLETPPKDSIKPNMKTTDLDIFASQHLESKCLSRKGAVHLNIPQTFGT